MPVSRLVLVCYCVVNHTWLSQWCGRRRVVYIMTEWRFTVRRLPLPNLRMKTGVAKTPAVSTSDKALLYSCNTAELVRGCSGHPFYPALCVTFYTCVSALYWLVSRIGSISVSSGNREKRRERYISSLCDVGRGRVQSPLIRRIFKTFSVPDQ